MSSNNNDVPEPESLLSGSLLHGFVTNQNMKPDGDGNYIINYGDPEYIEVAGDPLMISREERSNPEVDDIIVCVNFAQKTATMIVGDASLDVSDRYFLSLE